MLREEISTKIQNLLEDSGYSIARQSCPSCFDFLAKKKIILLVKVLTNIDSLYEEQAQDLKRIAEVLEAAPVIVGIFAKGEYIHAHTLYERYGIPAVNFETFSETILEQKYPFVYSKKGGFYAHLNSEFLKQLREKHNLSLGALAREAGISKKTISDYEKGKGAEVENILRLQKTLGDLLLEPLDIFSFHPKHIAPIKETTLEKSVHKHFDEIGFNTATVSKASFSIIGKHKQNVILTGLKKTSLQKKAHDIHNVTSALHQHGMFVFEKTNEKVISGVPVLNSEEFKGVMTSRELLKLLKELSNE